MSDEKLEELAKLRIKLKKLDDTPEAYRTVDTIMESIQIREEIKLIEKDM